MKATKVTNNSRILTTIGLLIFAISLGYGQGLLAEGAIKLFQGSKPEVELNTPEFTFANYTAEKEDSFSLKNVIRDAFTAEAEVEATENSVNIARTIQVSAVEVSYEAAIETESWMTVPLENNLESSLEVESWMTESFNLAFEAELTVEEWMTYPISESLESELEVEDWMTVSFTESAEEEIVVEDWMTQSLVAR